MPYNGSGVFSRLYNWTNDANSGINIDPTRMDTDTNDIVTSGLTNCVTRDGQSAATAALPMGGFNHTNVANGTARNHYAAIGQLQDGAILTGGTSSGTNTITFNLTPSLTAYVTGQRFSFIAGGTNTGSVTANANGVGAKSVTKRGTTPLVANDILSGGVYIIEYDGTQFQLLNPSDGTPATNSIANTQLAQMTTLTIKSNITGGTANAADNTLSAIIDAAVGSTQGQINYRGASAWSALSPGTSGQVLKTGGAAANPSWASIASVLDNISSTQGGVLYRNASTWVALSPGTSGQFLQTQGASANPQWASSSSAYASLFTSSEQAVGSNGTTTDVAHSLGSVPTAVRVVLRCKTTDLGWSVGDEVLVMLDRNDNYGVQIAANSTNVRITIGSNGIYMLNTSGAATAITTANWRFVIYAAK